ncbi:MAG: aminotransferase class I/II-fold pyridoxal phosphate-dependent enzyme [Chloroflexi bacterium]|nr:aminotransferase class I/II-fold pyridoxal phosphate-dependent enzyme [Chloroflexota bacterium]MCY4246038.1 aminotransferase class I/II-fold pyridoxal phosphate-dependent enzyme [Chloroflexota bacterium]
MNYPPFEIENFFRQYEFSSPYQLSASDCEPLTLPELLEYASPARRQQFESLWLGYTESQGHPELLAAIADMHEGIEPRQALGVVPEEGIFLAMNALLEAGDHVVAIYPAFQSLYEIARVKGCELSYWQPRRTDDGWAFDVDELAALIRPDTRMLIINFPHNPTGCLPSHADFARIVELASARGLLLFSDEIYRFAEQDPAARLPSACEVYEKAVALGGLSKCFGAPGLRTGWLISRDERLLNECQELKSYTTICASAPGEILAVIALENWQALAARAIDIVQRNIISAKAFFGRYPDLFWVDYPRCGTISLAELKADMPVSEFAEAIVNEQGVMALPGNIMRFAGNYFRLGFGRRSLPQAFEPFEQFIHDRLL